MIMEYNYNKEKYKKKEARKVKYLFTWHTQFYLTGIIIAALTN